jgi:hypothetical protein
MLADQIRQAAGKDKRPRVALAKAAGLHHVNLSQFISGARSLPLPALERLAAALGLSISLSRRAKRL